MSHIFGVSIAEHPDLLELKPCISGCQDICVRVVHGEQPCQRLAARLIRRVPGEQAMNFAGGVVSPLSRQGAAPSIAPSWKGAASE